MSPQIPLLVHVESGHAEGLPAPGKGENRGFCRTPHAANGSLLSSSLIPLLLPYCNYFPVNIATVHLGANGTVIISCFNYTLLGKNWYAKSLPKMFFLGTHTTITSKSVEFHLTCPLEGIIWHVVSGQLLLKACAPEEGESERDLEEVNSYVF